jgi:hypothetical protein
VQRELPASHVTVIAHVELPELDAATAPWNCGGRKQSPVGTTDAQLERGDSQNAPVSDAAATA